MQPLKLHQILPIRVERHASLWFNYTEAWFLENDGVQKGLGLLFETYLTREGFALMINCSECGHNISSEAESCTQCGRPVKWHDVKLGFSGVLSSLNSKNGIEVKGGFNKIVFWFLLANFAVIVSLTVTTGGAAVGFIPVVLLVGGLFPFIALLFSKTLAKRAHSIEIIHSNSKNESERQLYEIVDVLRKKAGLREMPEVGVFQANEMNAFATGASKRSALIAFSDTLLRNMDEDAIAAVAAHELAHISNGDMITLSIVQSVTNALAIVVTLPLTALKIGALFNRNVGYTTYLLISLAKFVVVSIMLFLGNLVVKFFSRRREFAADKLASELVGKGAMIKALSSLSGDVGNVKYSKSLESYSALKINSPASSLLDIFSTHPSIERRIARLESL